MWLKRTAGVTLILTFIISGYIVIRGIFFTKPVTTIVPSAIKTEGTSGTPPVIALSADPESVQVGQYSVIAWSVTGQSPKCTASGDWHDDRTLVGAMSSGKLTEPRTYTYTLICTDANGSDKKTVTITANPI